MLDTRDAIAAQFRKQYGSALVANDVERPNVVPYFIGVFDTVAALGHKYLGLALGVSSVALVLGLCFLGAVLEPSFPLAGWTVRMLVYFGVAAALIGFALNYLKIAPPLPGYGVLKRLATLHLAPPKHKFYDTTLNRNVAYAKHAISIDENRADFKRVSWTPVEEKLDKRDEHGNLYFEQVWFPGVHADVGGGYLENDARLSDVALNWMVAGASIIPNGLKHDGSVLRLSPDAAGPQHNEQAGSFLKAGIRNLPRNEAGLSEAPMHKSVYRRFEAGPVKLYDSIVEYRPNNMRVHADFAHYFDAGSREPPKYVADDIELKWKDAGCVGRL